MSASIINNALTFDLSGRIDSNNSDQFEQDVRSELSLVDDVGLAFDATKLEYISSAGLRVLLKFKKETKRPVKIFNVSDEVFDILDVTGFTEILDVERTMREISIRGCKLISSAINGEIYKLSDDEMIKVFAKTVTLEDIKKERSLAQAALISGIPTLIPYDVVKCESGNGIIFEKAEMSSLSYILSHEPGRLSELAERLAALMRELHTTNVNTEKFPDIKDRYREWLKYSGILDDSKVQIYSTLISNIPDSDTYVHGDINLNSVMVQGDELLLLDMAGSAHGNSLFDLQGLFASLVAIERTDNGYCRRSFGISAEACLKFWNIFFRKYMDEKEQEIKAMNELLVKNYVLKQQILLKIEEKNRLQGHF